MNLGSMLVRRSREGGCRMSTLKLLSQVAMVGILLLAAGCSTTRGGEEDHVVSGAVPGRAERGDGDGSQPEACVDAPTPVEGPADERLVDYTDADHDALIGQRTLHGLCRLTRDQLFADPRSVDLYEQFGVVLLPREEAAWREMLSISGPAQAAIERMRGRAGFLLSEADRATGRYTVHATEAGIPELSAIVDDEGADEGIIFHEVAFDLSEMNDFEERLLALLSESQRDNVVEVDIEPDTLVFSLLRSASDLDVIRLVLEGAVDTFAPGLHIEFVETEEQEAQTALCPDRTRCAPVGGGLTFSDIMCSTGPPVVRTSDGVRGISTAGHCSAVPDFSQLSLLSNRSDTTNTPNGSPSISFLVLVENYANGGNRDFAVVANGAQTNYIQNVYRRDTVKPLNEVRRAETVSVDDAVCISARNLAARRCGVVVDVDQDASYNDNGVVTNIQNLFEVDMNDVGVSVGDSGGTLARSTADTTVLGILSGLNDGGDGALVSQNLAPGWQVLLRRLRRIRWCSSPQRVRVFLRLRPASRARLLRFGLLGKPSRRGATVRTRAEGWKQELPDGSGTPQ